MVGGKEGSDARQQIGAASLVSRRDHIPIVVDFQIGDLAQQGDGRVPGGKAFGCPSCGDGILFELMALGGVNLTAQLLGLGGATCDATNRLSMNTPNVLLNNTGASMDVTVNKNAAANDPSFSFKSAFSVRALFGILPARLMASGASKLLLLSDS